MKINFRPSVLSQIYKNKSSNDSPITKLYLFLKQKRRKIFGEVGKETFYGLRVAGYELRVAGSGRNSQLATRNPQPVNL